MSGQTDLREQGERLLRDLGFALTYGDDPYRRVTDIRWDCIIHMERLREAPSHTKSDADAFEARYRAILARHGIKVTA